MKNNLLSSAWRLSLLCRRYCTVRNALFSPVADFLPTSGNKVTIVGAGSVGMACASHILGGYITSEVCLVDSNPRKLMGEALDLQHGATFMNNPQITTCTDYAQTADSRVCIVTAGAAQRPDEDRISLLQRNVDVLKAIIPNLVKYSPKAILLIVSNPVDILTFVAWKLSGLSRYHVIGSGTNLDSSRFRFLLSQRLGVAPTSCHGWIIGEHGDSSVPVWSGVNVAGVRLRDILPTLGTEKDPDKWGLHLVGYWSVRNCTDFINIDQQQKSGRCFNIGPRKYELGVPGAMARLIEACIFTSKQTEQNIRKDVFFSLPCVLSGNGVTAIIKQSLTPFERTQLHNSANILDDIQSQLNF